MASAITYTMSNESVTVVIGGKSTVVRKGAPNYVAIRQAIINEDWDSVAANFTVAKSIKAWAKGKFSVRGEDTFCFEGEQLPGNINQRVMKMVTNNEDPTPILRFFERLQKNPSKRSVDQLYNFIEHTGIPLTKDGCFYAYKKVKSDFKDVHSGTFDNSPGKTLEMPRNKISDDPREACHEGFHVGALGYAGTFHGSDGKMVICKVDPADVVCVPYDSNQEKMRVCKYKVVGMFSGNKMPDTIIDEETEHEGDEVDPQVEANEAADEAKIQANAKNFYLNEAHELPTVTKSEARKERSAAKGSSFDKLRKMNTKELMEESIDVLRQFAGKGLSIVGASKIPGGKTALVAAIMKNKRH